MDSPRLSPLLLVSLLPLLLWLAGWFGWSAQWNGLLYDRMAALEDIADMPPPRVLLVEGTAPEEAAGWRRLFAELEGNGASLILLSRLPPSLPLETAVRLAADYPLLVGLPSAPPAGTPEGLAWGLALVPPIEWGVARDQWSGATVGGRWLPAVERVAAERLGGAAPDGRYRVDFGRGPGSLPVVEMARVTAGGLVPELVAGRVAVVVPARTAAVPLHAPAAGGELSLGRYRAHALDTLLNGRLLKQLDAPWLNGLIAGVVALSLLLLATRLPAAGLTPFFALLLLLTLAAGWALLIFLLWWPPLVELLLAEGTAWLLVRRSHAARAERALREVALESAAKLESRWTPEGFDDADEHWSRIAALITQTLALRRVILLDRVEGDHRVREVKALNCGLEDIGEMRRDYQRPPYTTAIEAGGPIRPFRDYLRPLDGEAEEQYLVPLLFAGDVLGFWAFGAKPVSEEERPRFIGIVNEFAGQIAELLHQRRQWRRRRESEQRPLRRLLRLEPEDAGYRAVRRSMTLLNRRLTVMESVLDGLDSAAILYDLFGRVIQVNRPMEELLRRAGLAPFDLTAADLIARLSDRPLDEARGYISYLIVKQGSITLPARLGEERDGGLMLKVRPIRQREGEGGDEARPFEMLGVLCELVDVSRLRDLYRLKEQLVDRVSARFRNDLEAVVVACSLIRDQRLPAADREEVFGLIGQKVDDAVEANEEIQRMLAVDLGAVGVERYPVDVVEALDGALAALEEPLRRRGVTPAARLPRLLGLAFAAPGRLEGVFEAVFKLLLGDAAEGSELPVEAVNYGRIVMIKLENSGFGIPDERLQAYLAGGEELTSEGFRELRQAQRQVAEWGGELVVHGAVGEGMKVTIALEAFDS